MLSCKGRNIPVFRKGDTVLGASGGASTVGRWGLELELVRGRVLEVGSCCDGIWVGA